MRVREVCSKHVRLATLFHPIQATAEFFVQFRRRGSEFPATIFEAVDDRWIPH